MITYHDLEWGVPLHDDRKLFEFMILDTFQAGLSWEIVLRKREAFRKAFTGFDPQRVARFGERGLLRLLSDSGIIRNRAKIQATVGNAKRFLRIQQEFGSFDAYVWKFVEGKTIHHRFARDSDIPATSPEAQKLSADLKKWGFAFVGPTIIYAFMQAAGLANDHVIGCFRYSQV